MVIHVGRWTMFAWAWTNLKILVTRSVPRNSTVQDFSAVVTFSSVYDEIFRRYKTWVGVESFRQCCEADLHGGRRTTTWVIFFVDQSLFRGGNPKFPGSDQG